MEVVYLCSLNLYTTYRLTYARVAYFSWVYGIVHMKPLANEHQDSDSDDFPIALPETNSSPLKIDRKRDPGIGYHHL